MRSVRRVGIALFMLVALLPAAAFMAAAPDHPRDVALSIAQPMSGLPTVRVFGGRDLASTPGLLVLVGTALMGIASIVRRTTRH
jgi:hypothetical protein